VNWPVCNNGITHSSLPPTHVPYLPLLASCKVIGVSGHLLNVCEHDISQSVCANFTGIYKLDAPSDKDIVVNRCLQRFCSLLIMWFRFL